LILKCSIQVCIFCLAHFKVLLAIRRKTAASDNSIMLERIRLYTPNCNSLLAPTKSEQPCMQYVRGTHQVAAFPDYSTVDPECCDLVGTSDVLQGCHDFVGATITTSRPMPTILISVKHRP